MHAPSLMSCHRKSCSLHPVVDTVVCSSLACRITFYPTSSFVVCVRRSSTCDSLPTTGNTANRSTTLMHTYIPYKIASCTNAHHIYSTVHWVFSMVANQLSSSPHLIKREALAARLRAFTCLYFLFLQERNRPAKQIALSLSPLSVISWQ